MSEIINDQQQITFRIKPIKGCNKGVKWFEFTTEINNVEIRGLPELLIDMGYFDYMGHPCDHFEVIHLTTIKRLLLSGKPQST